MSVEIVLDMDGVLANFTAGACDAHGRTTSSPKWNFFEDWGITVDEFWDGIHSFGDDFYKYLVPKFPWTDDLVALVRSIDPDFVIMSSPSDHAIGYAAKKIWLDKYVPGLKADQLIVGSRKHLLARPGRVLIDDYHKNIQRWAEAGGDFVLFPQPWNDNRLLVDDRVGYVAHTLRYVGHVLAEAA